jgi:hypothetical protein
MRSLITSAALLLAVGASAQVPGECWPRWRHFFNDTIPFSPCGVPICGDDTVYAWVFGVQLGDCMSMQDTYTSGEVVNLHTRYWVIIPEDTSSCDWMPMIDIITKPCP